MKREIWECTFTVLEWSAFSSNDTPEGSICSRALLNKNMVLLDVSLLQKFKMIILRASYSEWGVHFVLKGSCSWSSLCCFPVLFLSPCLVLFNFFCFRVPLSLPSPSLFSFVWLASVMVPTSCYSQSCDRNSACWRQELMASGDVMVACHDHTCCSWSSLNIHMWLSPIV